MKSLSRILAATLILVLSLSLLQGCVSNNSASTSKPDTTTVAATVATTANTTAATTAAATTASQQETSNSSWQVINEVVIKHKYNYSGFLNDTFGITVGYGGEIHYTNDGGKTWPNSVNYSACRFGLDIVDQKIAWCCGNAGNNRVTSDGGETWQEVADFGLSEPNQCRFLSFIDAKTGWIAAPTKFASTIDSGKTWKEYKLPEGVKEIATIFLKSATEGYLLDCSGLLFYTKDFGKTWTSRDIGMKGAGIAAGIITNKVDSTPQACMQFSDPNNGCIVIVESNKGAKIHVLTTTDGGKTWSSELLPVKSTFASPYLTRDGKLLTITSKANSKIIVLKHK